MYSENRAIRIISARMMNPASANLFLVSLRSVITSIAPRLLRGARLMLFAIFCSDMIIDLHFGIAL